ncbi:Folate receptor alpha [Bagarius yarrelli]|uniref:Folate receptor alpha n=1 Tax=Bagarius yarrelli TaxID=175774 RepID=A0A556VW12_BAGYA|nr:Folate receptor alpha [Bagarius yarrelli]
MWEEHCQFSMECISSYTPEDNNDENLNTSKEPEAEEKELRRRLQRNMTETKESENEAQCAPWRENACCTANTSAEAHEDNSYLYNFNWNHCGIMSKKCTNRCPAGAQCQKWTDVFPTAQSMCEKIWSNSYKYTTYRKDSGRCMQLWFEGQNPNKKVAEFYLNHGSRTEIAMKTSFTLSLAVLLLML